jgi:hypothetical protein
VSVSTRTFQPILIFAGEAGAYPKVEHLKGALLGQAQALPANIRIGLKGLPGTNTLAYYENLLITAVKSLIVHAPGKFVYLTLKVSKFECCFSYFFTGALP